MHRLRIPIDERVEEALLLAIKLAEINSKLETVTTSITPSRRSENEIICKFDVYSDYRVLLAVCTSETGRRRNCETRKLNRQCKFCSTCGMEVM